MLQFNILAQGLFRQEQLTVEYDPTYRLHVTPAEQAWIEQCWQEKLAQAKQQHNLLFDGPLYRFRTVRVSPDQQQLHLALGNTTYKEYATTRTSTFAEGRTAAELGCPLAVCAVVETSDGIILLDRRQGMDVGNGRYHVIGGFVERSRDAITETATGKVSANPFGAMRREIYEETGIREEDIAAHYCLGVAYDLENPHGELLFLTQLNIPLADVYQRTPQDHEIKKLHTLQVTPDSLRDFILRHHGVYLSTTGEPNLLLYGNWKFGTAWYQSTIEQLKTLA
jgi:NTP pyrophosphohydrolases containing a Zn-finger, probably nucleic-acid-binding